MAHWIGEWSPKFRAWYWKKTGFWLWGLKEATGLKPLPATEQTNMSKEEFFEFMTELHRGMFMPEKMCIDTEYGDTVTMKEYCHRRGIAMIGRKDGTSVYIPEN